MFPNWANLSVAHLPQGAGTQHSSVDIPSCSICLETHKDPKVLPCLHSFCQVCLERLVTIDKSNIKCPECRTIHKVPANGVVGFLSDTRLIKEIMEKKADTQTVDVCGMCHSKDVAVCFCLNCNTHLCSACQQSHMQLKKVFEQHVTVAPNKSGHATRATVSPSYKCSDHPGEDLKVYCIKCETVICRDCALYNHQSHSFKPAEKAVNEITRAVQKLKGNAAIKLKQFEENKSIVKRHEQITTTEPQKLKGRINEEFEVALKRLNSRKQQLLAQVDQEFEAYSKQVWASKDSVDKTICSLKGSINFTDRILQGSDEIELAVLGSRAIPQLKSVCKSNWSSDKLDSMYPIVFTPTISFNVKAKPGHQSSTPTPTPPELCMCIDKFGSIINYGRPKAVENLKIESIGYEEPQDQGYKVVNYSGHHLSKGQHDSFADPSGATVCWFQKNQSYNVKITGIPLPVNITKSYPQFEAMATVELHGQSHLHYDPTPRAAPAKIERSFVKNDDHWKLSFRTPQRGDYTINVKVKLGTKYLLQKSSTLTFQ